jgi:hypothetical protein
MYHAVTVLAVSALLLLTWGVIGITPVVLLPVGAALLYGIVYVLSEPDAGRKDVLAKPVKAARHAPSSAPSDD